MKYKKRIIFIVLFLYLITCFLFHFIFIPTAVIEGECLNSAKVLALINRGSFIPNDVKDIKFKLYGRDAPRAVVYLTGKISYKKLLKWAKENGYKKEEMNYSINLPQGVSTNLKIKAYEIENGIEFTNTTNRGDNIVYDVKMNKLYAYLFLGTKKSWTDSRNFINLLFPFLTSSITDKKIKGNLDNN
jgi:hypothetical protein